MKKLHTLVPVTCKVTGTRLLVRDDDIDEARHDRELREPEILSESSVVETAGEEPPKPPSTSGAPHPALESAEAFRTAKADDAIEAVLLMPASMKSGLDELERIERAGKNRKTVLDAIAERRKALAG